MCNLITDRKFCKEIPIPNISMKNNRKREHINLNAELQVLQSFANQKKKWDRHTMLLEGVAVMTGSSTPEGVITLGSVGPFDIYIIKEQDIMKIWCLKRAFEPVLVSVSHRFAHVLVSVSHRFGSFRRWNFPFPSSSDHPDLGVTYFFYSHKLTGFPFRFLRKMASNFENNDFVEPFTSVVEFGSSCMNV
ncbi:hypothetical protein WA026_019472 [Henosepilachna vigintioctopunctata]|uniref:Uncharacterized protein n=1 Tax=Henosepilachna vigintioctopunctata TaxID=420089 RepID=A0AAW1UAR4_9CUCU